MEAPILSAEVQAVERLCTNDVDRRDGAAEIAEQVPAATDGSTRLDDISPWPNVVEGTMAAAAGLCPV